MANPMHDPEPTAYSPRRSLAPIVIVSRIVHALVAVFFLGCIAIVWVAALHGRAGPWTDAALISLGVEIALVAVNRGNCPLGPIARRLGDDKPLFDLICGRYGKHAFPVLAVVIVAGVALLGVQVL
jgi:hypothetical protein